MDSRSEVLREASEGDVGDVMDERGRLINVAYRLLGSLTDAEDVVQETYARWLAMSEAQRQGIVSPQAWLTTVASRICLDQLRSARVRREQYVGEWLPEPVPGPTPWTSDRPAPADPAEHVTLDESVSMAFLVVLETMSPAERVAFILHDVFRFPFSHVAEVLDRTAAACRQLAASARRRVRAAQDAPVPTPRPMPGQVEVVREFRRAWEAMDIPALVDLLDPHATAVADGGGRVAAAREPIEGAEAIARYYVTLASKSPDDVHLEERPVNGRPGLVQRFRGLAATVFAFDVDEGRITRIWAVRNPDKLRAWHAVA